MFSVRSRHLALPQERPPSLYSKARLSGAEERVYAGAAGVSAGYWVGGRYGQGESQKGSAVVEEGSLGAFVKTVYC